MDYKVKMKELKTKILPKIEKCMRKETMNSKTPTLGEQIRGGET